MLHIISSIFINFALIGDICWNIEFNYKIIAISYSYVNDDQEIFFYLAIWWKISLKCIKAIPAKLQTNKKKSNAINFLSVRFFHHPAIKSHTQV